MTEKPTIVKADGYDETFNRQGASQPKPFYLAGDSNIARFYEEDGLARRIIDVVPEEMVGAGFKVTGIDDDAEFRSVWDEKLLSAKIIDALCWSRLFGGSAIVAIVGDNRLLKSPVKEGAQLEDIRVYDRHQITVDTRDTNPRSVRFGQPVLYKVSVGNNVPDVQVHYSRIHIIDGERRTIQSRQAADGWGSGVLNQRLIHAILDYNECERLATELLRRKQQGVWKAKGLAMLCDDNEGHYAARLRLAQVDDNSGVGKAIGIDAIDEDYSILNSDLGGVTDLLASKMDRVVALSGIHEIILRNKNVGGVSASQNTALETFYKLIERKRQEDYKPLLEFLLPFIISEQEWSIEFEPLSVPSDKDSAEILNKNVDSVTKALAEQMIDVEEARDTLRNICQQFKLKDTDNIKLPEETTEPEPGEVSNEG